MSFELGTQFLCLLEHTDNVFEKVSLLFGIFLLYKNMS